MLPCLNKSLFGMECYGCGAQRATMMLLHGKFTDAFYMYAPIYAIIPLVSLVIFNLFVSFKNDFIIKIGLVLFTALVILVNYGIKLYHFFNL
ncbi:MAG: DUF2752 domain-containing protein [Gillisia sp.]